MQNLAKGLRTLITVSGLKPMSYLSTDDGSCANFLVEFVDVSLRTSQQGGASVGNGTASIAVGTATSDLHAASTNKI